MVIKTMANFTAVNTKIRVLEDRFLTEKDYENLLHMKNVQEIASYLKRETHYRHILGDINENDIHRRQLEVLIRRDHVKQIEKLSHYFYDGYRKFFRYVFIKREIENLKEILRGIENGRNFERNEESFPHIGRFSNVNMEALLSSKSTGDFIKSLRGTIYYKYLEPLEESKGGIFMGEMALDLAYFDMFYGNLIEIDKRDRVIVDRLQGTNVDLLNIQWVYRGLKYYNLSREILYNYTIPHGFELSRSDIKDLCYSKDSDELKERILKTRYNFLFDNEATRDIFMERRILRYQYFNIRKIRSRHRMDISEALAFDVLLEYEIRDIVTVIECIRYDMPSDEAVKYLIRKL